MRMLKGDDINLTPSRTSPQSKLAIHGGAEVKQLDLTSPSSARSAAVITSTSLRRRFGVYDRW